MSRRLGISITLSGKEFEFTFLAQCPTENTGYSSLIFFNVSALLLKQSLANHAIPGILSFLGIVNNGKSSFISNTGTANGNHNPLVLGSQRPDLRVAGRGAARQRDVPPLQQLPDDGEADAPVRAGHDDAVRKRCSG